MGGLLDGLGGGAKLGSAFDIEGVSNNSVEGGDATAAAAAAAAAFAAARLLTRREADAVRGGKEGSAGADVFGASKTSLSKRRFSRCRLTIWS